MEEGTRTVTSETGKTRGRTYVIGIQYTRDRSTGKDKDEDGPGGVGWTEVDRRTMSPDRQTRVGRDKREWVRIPCQSRLAVLQDVSLFNLRRIIIKVDILMDEVSYTIKIKVGDPVVSYLGKVEDVLLANHNFC